MQILISDLANQDIQVCRWPLLILIQDKEMDRLNESKLEEPLAESMRGMPNCRDVLGSAPYHPSEQV